MSLTPPVGKLQRRFSFTSYSNSTLAHSSEFYTTDCSESTVRGPGALSGTALKALGKLVLRTADDIVIQLRITSILRSMKTNFHRSEWDDLLEFSRREVYNTSIRQRAFETLLVGIESQPKTLIISNREDSLISRILKLPLTEIEIFVSEMISCLPDDRLDYIPSRLIVHENVRSIFRSDPSSRKRYITTQFAELLEELVCRECCSGFFDLDRLLGLSPDIDGRLLKAASLVAGIMTPSFDLDGAQLLKFVAIGDPMWTRLGTFLKECATGHSQELWSRMTTAIMQPSSWTFLVYKERVCRYRDVDPTLHFLEFCAKFCPDSIGHFYRVGLQSCFLSLLSGFLSDTRVKFDKYTYHKYSEPAVRQVLLRDTALQLLDFMRKEYNGSGDIDLDQQYIVGVCLVALLAMSPIVHCKDDGSKLRYKTCIASMLLLVMEDLEIWALNVSFRNVIGAGSDLDPNVLLIVFRVLEKLYELPKHRHVLSSLTTLLPVGQNRPEYLLIQLLALSKSYTK